MTRSTKIIALAGNPNCGKTTLFNALTGLRYKVANYPGVTVEKKEGSLALPDFKDAQIIDLPGTYNLSGHAIDEVIATHALLGEIKGEPRPDLIVSVIDASNLERNLYLTSQLIDLHIPLIIALNMVDTATKRGITIRSELLAQRLGVPVIPIVASKKEGLESLRTQINSALLSGTPSKKAEEWIPKDSPLRDTARALGEDELQQNTNKECALLVGTLLLSEGLTPRDPTLFLKVQEARSALHDQGIDADSFEATFRYQWINSIVHQSCVVTDSRSKRRSDRLDHIATHKVWGSLIFIGLMGLIFNSIFLWASLPMDFIDGLFSSLGADIGALLPEGHLKSLIVDGIIAGVGSVVVFIPQIAILFFFLGILEDTGYLSRAAFLMDRVMRPFGLQGRSFIPLLSSFACAIPGILSTRTIPSFADRLTTILIAPLMSCSARLPVYTLLIAAFVPRTYYLGFISLQGLVLLGMYLLGIFGAAIVSWLLKLTMLRGAPALFVMEMPTFRRPSLVLVIREVFDRIVIFLKNAGTMILACSIVLWFLASFPQGDVKDSFAGQIGQLMEPVIEPLGYTWEIGVGLLASFAAREVFVSSLATVYNLQAGDDSAQSLIKVLQSKKMDGSFTLATALSLMVFFVFACQCMSTVAVARRETGSWRWTGFMVAYMTLLAYAAAFVTYHGARHFIG